MHYVTEGFMKSSSHYNYETLGAAALALASITALRFGDSPLGASELMLALAFLSSMFVSKALSPFNHPVLVFWLFNLVVLSFGWSAGILGSAELQLTVVQDAVALLFAGIISTFFLTVFTDLERSGRFFRVINGFSLVFLSVVLVAALAFGHGWESGGRLYGFSKNPNQLAFSCYISMLSAAVFTSYFDLDVRDRLLGYSNFALSLCVGLMTGSDALVLSVPFVVLVSAVVYLFGESESKRYFLKVTLIFILAFAFLYLISSIDSIRALLRGISDDGDQGSVRFILWANGVEAVSMSPWIGWGPGAWSGLYRPLEGAEAHNTFIDWATKSGVFGVASLVALNSYVFFRLLKAKLVVVAAVYLGMVFFSCFHLVVRQPGYWMAMSLPALLISGGKRPQRQIN